MKRRHSIEMVLRLKVFTKGLLQIGSADLRYFVNITYGFEEKVGVDAIFLVGPAMFGIDSPM